LLYINVKNLLQFKLVVTGNRRSKTAKIKNFMQLSAKLKLGIARTHSLSPHRLISTAYARNKRYLHTVNKVT
jgi:hypothetical protein